MTAYHLKATNEQQDDGASILHQVLQFPIDQVYLIYKAPMPLSIHARPRETRYWASFNSKYIQIWKKEYTSHFRNPASLNNVSLQSVQSVGVLLSL